MFSGSIVAIVTPFRNGKLDERAFLLRHHEIGRGLAARFSVREALPD